MDVFMKDIGWMIYMMDKAFILMKMEVLLKDISKVVNHTDIVY
jgi:hypothetical protein